MLEEFRARNLGIPILVLSGRLTKHGIERWNWAPATCFRSRWIWMSLYARFSCLSMQPRSCREPPNRALTRALNSASWAAARRQSFGGFVAGHGGIHSPAAPNNTLSETNESNNQHAWPNRFME